MGRMRSLIYLGGGRLEWQERDEPTIGDAGDALVRPLAVTTCDLDGAIGPGLLDDLGTGYPVGHEFVAEVVDVGDRVTGQVPGDRVVVPFQLSCGRCRRCRLGRTAACDRAATVDSYGLPGSAHRRGGAMDDLVLVPNADHMLVALPDELPLAAAALSDNVGDGWRTVGPYLDEVEGPILVGGFASIGLYATAFAASAGHEVHYRDTDAARREAAAALGATVLDEDPSAPATDTYELVVSTAPSTEQLHSSLASTHRGGRCVTTGMHLGETTPVPLFQLYLRSIRVVAETVQARAVLPDAMAAVRTHGIDLDSFVEHARWEDGPDAWAASRRKLLFTRA